MIADIALCPFEAVKVRVQTQPGFARGLSDGLPKFVRSEGPMGYAIYLCFAHSLICTLQNSFLFFPTFVQLVQRLGTSLGTSDSM